MIISVSRRTDIPAFYMEWFVNRINAGYVYVRNPMNRKQISEVSLKAEDVSCYVFWTKNPSELLKCHGMINAPYMLQMTLTPYLKDIEKNLPDKREIIKNIIKLSQVIGSKRIIWRYDPILFTEKYTIAYHLEYFEKLCKYLKGSINYCVISFVEVYKKVKAQLSHIKVLNDVEKEEFLKRLVSIATAYNITVKMCGSDTDYSNLYILKSQCIDETILESMAIRGFKKDRYQRETCQCIESVDIGSYDTCMHGCVYCYANSNHKKAEMFNVSFDYHSELLGEALTGDELIKPRKLHNNQQITLL
ncbi:MAG: DUF1848 domain-containing protein [Clostridiales bacterium]|nr:DUF1848 domain-containing protein [Clostridiales bacterium]